MEGELLVMRNSSCCYKLLVLLDGALDATVTPPPRLKSRVEVLRGLVSGFLKMNPL